MADAALKLTLLASISGYVRGSNDISAPEQDLNVNERIALSLGTMAGQADLLFSDTRTIAASGTDSLDLAGVLTDAFGQVMTAVEIVGVLVFAHAGNTNDVVVGGAPSNTWTGFFGDPTDKLKVKPGGFAFIAAPTNPAYPVTAGTGDLLLVANSSSGTSVDYDIVVIGRSA